MEPLPGFALVFLPVNRLRSMFMNPLLCMMLTHISVMPLVQLVPMLCIMAPRLVRPPLAASPHRLLAQPGLRKVRYMYMLVLGHMGIVIARGHQGGAVRPQARHW